MAFITPKTNWTENDYFNYYDYNRIKNNIEYLAQQFDPPVMIMDMGEDKTVRDFFYADEMTRIQTNLGFLCTRLNLAYEGKIYSPEGPVMFYWELNQMEQLIADIAFEIDPDMGYAIDATGVRAVDSNNIRARAM